MKKFVLSVVLLGALFFIGYGIMKYTGAEPKHEVEPESSVVETPKAALELLKEGNLRYVNNHCLFPHHDHKRIEETAPKQNPFVAIVGCSDSRVPVELIFDQGIGDIFVIRTAGNSVNDAVVMGSVDYAVEHLGVKAVVVLGHESCGGVTGAISTASEHGEVAKLLDVIRQDVAPYVGKPDSLDAAIRMNADKQVERITSYPHIRSLIDKGELAVVRAYYNVHTGKVDF